MTFLSNNVSAFCNIVDSNYRLPSKEKVKQILRLSGIKEKRRHFVFSHFAYFTDLGSLDYEYSKNIDMARSIGDVPEIEDNN